LSSSQSTQSLNLNPQFFDDYAVKKLLCSIIEMAVLDYNLCVEKGFIYQRELAVCISLNHELPKTIENISEIKSLLTFFFEGGLEQLIEDGNLRGEAGNFLSADFIRKALL